MLSRSSWQSPLGFAAACLFASGVAFAQATVDDSDAVPVPGASPGGVVIDDGSSGIPDENTAPSGGGEIIIEDDTGTAAPAPTIDSDIDVIEKKAPDKNLPPVSPGPTDGGSNQEQGGGSLNFGGTAYATAPQGWLGLGIDPQDKDLDDGVPVRKIYQGSPAGQTTIQVGDMLTKIGQVDVRVPRDVRAVLMNTTPGTIVACVVSRGGIPSTVAVRLGSRPAVLPPLQVEQATTLPRNKEVASTLPPATPPAGSVIEPGTGDNTPGLPLDPTTPAIPTTPTVPSVDPVIDDPVIDTPPAIDTIDEAPNPTADPVVPSAPGANDDPVVDDATEPAADILDLDN